MHPDRKFKRLERSNENAIIVLLEAGFNGPEIEHLCRSHLAPRDITIMTARLAEKALGLEEKARRENSATLTVLEGSANA